MRVNSQETRHVFIAYVREDAQVVDRLIKELTKRGVKVWLDRNDIRPGMRWKEAIREAIRQGDFFISCFSNNYFSKSLTYMNEELTLAIEELRQYPTDRSWFIPVLLSECSIPNRNIGAGQTLLDIQWVALYKDWDNGVQNILNVIKPLPPNLQHLIYALNTEDNFVREQVVKLLGHIGNPISVPALMETLADKDENVRKAAAFALGRIGDPSAVPALTGLLNDEDEKVHRQAVEALSEIGDSAAFPALITVLEDKSFDLKQPNAEESDRDRVFLSYASEDLETVKKIYNGLKKRNLNLWFDKVLLKPGEWMPQIEKAIARSRYFVICISNAALKKLGDDRPGFQDEELKAAYKIAQVQPSTGFSIVPLRLEDCDRGDFRISTYQQYDLFIDFEGELDRLAVHFDGVSLGDSLAMDERTNDQKMVDHHVGKATAAYYAKAMGIWESVLAKESKKAAAFGRTGYHEEAIEALDKALQLQPDYADAWYTKGVVFESLKRHKDAIEAFDKALEFRPNSADAWLKRSNALFELGKYDEALKSCEILLKNNPENSEAINLKDKIIKVKDF